MVVATGLQIGAWMLVWGLIFRLIELTWKGSPVSQALGVIY